MRTATHTFSFFAWVALSLATLSAAAADAAVGAVAGRVAAPVPASGAMGCALQARAMLAGLCSACCVLAGGVRAGGVLTSGATTMVIMAAPCDY